MFKIESEKTKHYLTSLKILLEHIKTKKTMGVGVRSEKTKENRCLMEGLLWVFGQKKTKENREHGRRLFGVCLNQAVTGFCS